MWYSGGISGCGGGTEDSAVTKDEDQPEVNQVIVPVNVSGPWKFTVTGKEPPTGSMILTQMDTAISGTLTHDVESIPLADSIEGTSIKVNIQDGNGTVAEGTIVGNTMSGTWRDNLGGSGNWQATRQMKRPNSPR